MVVEEVCTLCTKGGLRYRTDEVCTLYTKGGLTYRAEEVRLFLAVREAAHVRLFTRVPWLGPHLISSIEKFASGVHIDMSRIEDVARQRRHRGGGLVL